jgi:hypothetical protein
MEKPIWPLFDQLPSKVFPDRGFLFPPLAKVAHDNVVRLGRLEMGMNGAGEVRFPMSGRPYIEDGATFWVGEPVLVYGAILEPFACSGSNIDLIPVIGLGPAFQRAKKVISGSGIFVVLVIAFPAPVIIVESPRPSPRLDYWKVMLLDGGDFFDRQRPFRTQ